MAVAATTPPWQHIAKITWAGPEGGFQFTGFEASERGYVLNPGTVAAAFNAIAWTLDADGNVIQQPWAQGYVASLGPPTLDRADIVQASNQADEITVGPGDDKVYARGGADVVDGGAWLHGLGLGQYEQAFRDNDVEADLLARLTAEDLKEAETLLEELASTPFGPRARPRQRFAT